MWQHVRVPIAGPIDQESARPFIPLGQAVPAAVGYVHHRGAILPWRATSLQEGLSSESVRVLDGVLVHTPTPVSSDIGEKYGVAGTDHSVGWPFSLARVKKTYALLRDITTLDSTLTQSACDAVDLQQWIVGVYASNWLYLVAVHKASGAVFTYTVREGVGGEYVWKWPRLLRDPTNANAALLSFAKTETAATSGSLGTALWNLGRVTLDLASGITYTVPPAWKANPQFRNQCECHDAREVPNTTDLYCVVGYHDSSDLSSYGFTLRALRTSGVEDLVTHTSTSQRCVGFGVISKSTSVDVLLLMLSSSLVCIRYTWTSAGGWSRTDPGPVTIPGPPGTQYGIAGDDTANEWRVITDMTYLVGLRNSDFTINTTAYYGSGFYVSVPYYYGGRWVYQITLQPTSGNPASSSTLLVAEVGSGTWTVLEGGYRNKVRLVPIGRLGTWVSKGVAPTCGVPKPVYGSTDVYLHLVDLLFDLRQLDATAYVVDYTKDVDTWPHDAVLVHGAEVLTQGLLTTPDEVVTEIGFAAPPHITVSALPGTDTVALAVQWLRHGVHGEAHYSAPTPVLLSNVDKDSIMLIVAAPITRTRGNVWALVWEADSAGVYKLLMRTRVDPLDSNTNLFVGTSLGSYIGGAAPWYGQLTHGPAPSPWHCCAHAGRLYVVSAENRGVIWQSLQLEDQLAAPVFDPTISIAANDETIHRVYSLDVGLIALGSSTAYVLRGDGPDNTGAGVLQELHAIPGAPPCAGVACVTPYGVLYWTGDAIALIDRGIGVSVISESVQDILHGRTVLAAAWSDELERAAVVVKSYGVLLWSKQHGWSVYSDTDAHDVRALKSGGLELLQRNEGTGVYDALQLAPLSTAAQALPLTVQTAWLDMVVRPWARVRKVRLRGRLLESADPDLRVWLYLYANGNGSAPAFSHSFALSEFEQFGGSIACTWRLPWQRYESLSIKVVTQKGVPVEWEWIEFEVQQRHGVNRTRSFGAGS